MASLTTRSPPPALPRGTRRVVYRCVDEENPGARSIRRIDRRSGSPAGASLRCCNAA